MANMPQRASIVQATLKRFLVTFPIQARLGQRSQLAHSSSRFPGNLLVFRLN
jgi:hypothetical protein